MSPSSRTPHPPREAARSIARFGAATLLLGCGAGGGEAPSGDGGFEQGADLGADLAPDATGQDTPPPDADQVADAAVELTAADFVRPDSCAGRWIVRLRGRVVDEGGAPIEGARAQYCLRTAPEGTRICQRPATSQSDGTFEVVVPPEGRCEMSGTMRVLMPDSGRATVYCPVPVGTAEPDHELAGAFVLVATTVPDAFPEEGDGASSRELLFDGDLSVTLAPDSLYTGASTGYGDLRGAAVPADSPAACWLRPDEAVAGLFAFSPEADANGAGFDLAFPNSHGWAPGSRVQLYLLAGLFTELESGALIKEGSWFPFAEGLVSESGDQIVSRPGEGLPYLSWLGYQLIP